ncbi:MAG: hypothetical protein ABI637_07005 [Gemmatimonadota bacterium]
MHRTRIAGLATLSAVAVLVGTARAAEAQSTAPAPVPLAVGEMAPDFTLPSATADGAAGLVSLRSLRGKTIVLAFFFKARTKG